MKVNINFKLDPAETMCAKCANGTVFKTGDEKHHTYCSQIKKMISRPVVECSGYEDKGTLGLGRLATMAYILDSAQLKKGKAGFLSPEQLKEKKIMVYADEGTVKLWEEKGD